MRLMPSGKTHIVMGFPMPMYDSIETAWHLILQWKSGKTTTYTARTMQEAVDQHHKISLRADLMQRLHVEGPGGSFALWDAAWPEVSRMDTLRAYGPDPRQKPLP